MTIRGGGDPTNSMGLQAALQNGPAARSLAADAHGCIMVLIPPWVDRIQACGTTICVEW
jgi:hypothetical protein